MDENRDFVHWVDKISIFIRQNLLNYKFYAFSSNGGDEN